MHCSLTVSAVNAANGTTAAQYKASVWLRPQNGTAHCSVKLHYICRSSQVGNLTVALLARFTIVVSVALHTKASLFVSEK